MRDLEDKKFAELVRADERAACAKREWVGLTEEEMEDLIITIPWPQVCNAIEAKLKEKNT
jgi:hypothetical protein